MAYFLVAICLYASGYSFWSGWKLRKTRDFTGWKIAGNIRPADLDKAVVFFSYVQFLAGVVFLAPLAFWFLARKDWHYVYAGLLLFGAVIFVGMLRFVWSRRSS